MRVGCRLSDSAKLLNLLTVKQESLTIQTSWIDPCHETREETFSRHFLSQISFQTRKMAAECWMNEKRRFKMESKLLLAVELWVLIECQGSYGFHWRWGKKANLMPKLKLSAEHWEKQIKTFVSKWQSFRDYSGQQKLLCQKISCNSTEHWLHRCLWWFRLKKNYKTF